MWEIVTIFTKKSKHTMCRFLVLMIFFLINPLLIPAQSNNNIEEEKEVSEHEKAILKFERTMHLINRHYVDSVDNAKLVEHAIRSMLRQMDPHSNYFTAEQIKRANQALEGSFSGIGVEYQIIEDTIFILAVRDNAPAQKAGLKQGDKILKIDDEIAAGNHINNSWVSNKIRGERDTEVILGVERHGFEELIKISVKRDNISTYSVDAYFMLDNETGYVKISRFMRTTVSEFEKAIEDLKDDGMKKLILDLRGNSGGYLNSAVRLSNHFLGRNKLIVYTEGLNSRRFEYKTTGRGVFKKGDLIILIDESSASASEIVTGAIQDWDRGLVLGRRSFGKGLVQKPYTLTDGSAIRLTIARYFTPVGRSIQRPYEEGRQKYYAEVNEKIRKGIYSNIDSIKLPDSLKYYTPKGRVVYGGGGIMPDIIISVDTTGNSDYLSDLKRINMFNRFALNLLLNHRDSLLNLYPDEDSFIENVDVTAQLFSQFIALAKSRGIEGSAKELSISMMKIEQEIMNRLVRLLYGSHAYWKAERQNDNMICKALEIINDENTANVFKLNRK